MRAGSIVRSPANALAVLAVCCAAAPSQDRGDVGISVASLFERDAPLPGGGKGGKYGARVGGREHLATRMPAVADAVAKGLAWLASSQADDGHWSAKRFLIGARDIELDGAGLASSDFGATVFATLAFLQDGGTTEDREHGRTVRRAVAWLARSQDPATGRFGLPVEDRHLLHHAVATLVMCEAYGLSRRETLRVFAVRGAGYCIRARAGQRLKLDRSLDVATTAWTVLALRAAEDFGLDPPPGWQRELAEWTEFRPPPDREDRPSDGAEAAQCGLSMLWLGDFERQELRRHERVTAITIGANERHDRVETMFLARFAYQLDGQIWRQIVPELSRIAGEQRSDGPYAGSWDPAGDWSREGGRVHATAIALLTLETPYAHTRVAR